MTTCAILVGAKTQVPATAFLLPCLIRLGAKPTLLASGKAVACLCLRKPSTASKVGFARPSAGGTAMASYTKTCVVCGKQFSSTRPTRVACSDKCQEFHRQNKAKRITSVTKKKKKLIKERGNCCQLCGATGTLHAHHIKPMSRGGSDDASNLLLVCPSCHKKFHSKGR